MRIHLLTALITAVTLAVPTLARADEDFGPYYEEDAWYDITEWFDGNNYNPEEEAIGDAGFDDTRIVNDYGYLDDNDDSWFYDYYDYDYSEWGDINDDDLYEYSSRYYDFDNDGIYEAFASFYDRDGDGTYEDMDYYSFGNIDPAADQQADGQADGEKRAAQDQQRRQSEEVAVKGSVQAIKRVQTPRQPHLVARVQGDQQDQTVVVDLGPAESIASPPELQDTLSATGPRMKVGDHVVVMAKQAELNGRNVPIDRSPRQFQGKITSLTTAKVGGHAHRLAKIQTGDNKSLMVDLGPQEALQKELSKGQSVKVTGVPMKVQDRRLLLANQLTRDGQTTQIARGQDQASRRR